MKEKRTIETILNLETGEIIESKIFFRDERAREAEIFQLRTEIERNIQLKRAVHVCIYCKQPVTIRGRSITKHFYFNHLYKSKECVIKTEHRLTEEQVRCVKYNGEKESDLHITLKNFIGNYLALDPQVESVLVDKIYRDEAVSTEWRKPDVLATFKDKKIAFELQLSTTFLSVIVGRTLFYKERGIYLLWIFPNFSLGTDLQKFTEKDIYYNNNFNVYALDRDAMERSAQENKLVLKCYYKKFATRSASKWICEFVRIDDLSFDRNSMSVCFHDTQSDLDQIIEQERLSREAELKMKEQQLITYKLRALSNRVERIVEIFRDVYRKDVVDETIDSLLLEIDTDEAIKLLNEKMQIREDLIVQLFSMNRKPNFLQFICKNDKIRVDVQVLQNGHTLLQLILKSALIVWRSQIANLFRKGYRLSDADRLFIDDLLKAELIMDNHEKWALCKLYERLITRRLSYDMLPQLKVLYSLLSVEKGRVVGLRFRNLKEVTNNVLEYHSEFGAIYLRSLEVHGRYEALLASDKSGKISRKIQSFQASKVSQNRDFDELIYEVFPMLT